MCTHIVYTDYMVINNKQRNHFVKVRVNSDDIQLRKEVTEFHGTNESAVDRMLWEQEAERIKDQNDNQRKK
jgi:hypothetical protein